MRYSWGKGDVVLAGDEEIASAHRSWFRERAEVTIGGVEWLFRAEGPTCWRPATTRQRPAR